MILTQHIIFRGYPKKVSDLSLNSSFKVEVRCPVCEKTRWVMYKSITKAGHTACQKCMAEQSCAKELIPGDIYHQVTILDKVTSGISLGECSCGTIKEFSNWHLKSGNTKSCGCLKKNNRLPQVLRGDQHPRWKGGISPARQRMMATNKYKEWRQSVYCRDDFTCQVCGQTGYKLNAHHIQNYSDNEKLRTVVSNGITMCLDCHKEFHTIYGRNNTSINQINEFEQEVNSERISQAH